jgi:colicin import membrane protein
MKKNIRAHVSRSRDRWDEGRMPLGLPLFISIACHLLFLAIVVFTPSLESEKMPARSVIDVRMVSFKKPDARTSVTPSVKTKAPVIKKPEVVEKPIVPQPAQKPVEIVDHAKPKPKTSLKKKTFKSTEVVKRALQDLEKKVEANTETPKEAHQLETALERMRQAVQESEKTGPGEDKSGKAVGRFSEDGRQTAELIDLYRIEIAYQIQKNWAFNQQLAGDDPSAVAAIVFKVMPDGEIRDIFFTDRSGNAALDDSAYKAILKSNPVDGHPKGLAQPFVVMAIRFTPQGIR